MRYALGAASLTQIRNMLPGRPMLAFDIDGTLAPIVAEPWRAHISEELRAFLRSLAARTPVAIITGRAFKDARPLLGFSPHFVVGNHGAEIHHDQDGAQQSEQGENDTRIERRPDRDDRGRR